MGSKRTSIGRIQKLIEAAVEDFMIQANIVPKTNLGADLGNSSLHFNNIFTGDLHLKNDRGNYTIIEEEEYLSIRNNKTGKLYKFVLEEVKEESELDVVEPEEVKEKTETPRTKKWWPF